MRNVIENTSLILRRGIFLTGFQKGPGRKYTVRPDSVSKRAYDLTLTLEGRRGPIDWESLLRGNLEEAVRAMTPVAREQYAAPYYDLIRMTLKDPDFPKINRESQIRFLAESIAGPSLAGRDVHGKYRMSLRRSRDICSELRNNPPHSIIRREPYVECSCGYQGPALDGACRECGAGSSDFPWESE